MKFRNILAAGLVIASSSSALARGWWELPPVDLGVHIPPVTEWKIGGTLGSLWEGNKAAIAWASAGSAVLGPFGLVYGLIEGHKYDVQKQAALKAKAHYEADPVTEEALKDAGLRWPSQAQAIGDLYVQTSTFLGEVSAPAGSADELNEIFYKVGLCIILAQDKYAADDCKFTFNEDANELQKKYR